MRAQEFITEAPSGYVYRIDSTRIPDFTQDMKTYYHNQDFSMSGREDFKGSVGSTQGVYAGTKLFTALYATGASSGADKTRYVAKYAPGQPTVYFDRKDLPRISRRHSWLSVFDAKRFRRLPSGEYFSENPGPVLAQKEITNPMAYIRSSGWKYRQVDDLEAVLDKLRSRGYKYGAEGMGTGEDQ